MDANGDGLRQPQQMGDMTVAAAILLCGERDDLSKPGEREAALTAFAPGPGFSQAVEEAYRYYLSKPFQESLLPEPVELEATRIYTPEELAAMEEAEQAEEEAAEETEPPEQQQEELKCPKGKKPGPGGKQCYPVKK